jgi:hypothetical protein
MIVQLTGNSIEVNSGVAGAISEFYPVADVAQVYGQYLPVMNYPDNYPYPTMTEVAIYFTDKTQSPLKFDLQKITGGALAALTGGTPVDLNAALVIINGWL